MGKSLSSSPNSGLLARLETEDLGSTSLGGLRNVRLYLRDDLNSPNKHGIKCSDYKSEVRFDL